MAIVFQFFIPTQSTTLAFRTAFVDGFDLGAEAGDGVIKLTWERVPGASGGYYVYRKDGENGTYGAPLTDFGVFGNVFYDGPIPNDNKYCYYIAPLDENYTEFGRSVEACSSPISQAPSFIEQCKTVLVFVVDSVNYLHNGVKRIMSSPFLLVGRRTYLAFRYVTEPLGGKIEWDQVQRKVTVTYKSTVVEMWVGKSQAKINGKPVQIDPSDPKVVPFVKDGRTFVPLRFPVESFGEGDVKWFAQTKQAQLTFPADCNEKLKGKVISYNNKTGMSEILGFEGESYVVVFGQSGSGSYIPVVGDCIEISGERKRKGTHEYFFVNSTSLIECQEGPFAGFGAVEKSDVLSASATISFEGGEKIDVRIDKAHIRMLAGLKLGDCVFAAGMVIKNPSGEKYINTIIFDMVPCKKGQADIVCDGKWYSGTVRDFDCTNGILTVALDDGQSKTVSIENSNFDCANLSVGYCTRFCAKEVDGKLVSSVFYAFPCGSSSCEGSLIRGKLVKIDCASLSMSIAQGDKYVEVAIFPKDCEDISSSMPECVEACVVKSGKRFIALKIKPYAECENECPGETVQVRIDRVDCAAKIIYCTKVATMEQMEINFTLPEFCPLEAGKCYEICIEEIRKPSQQPESIATHFRPIECKYRCSSQLVTGTIKSIDCSKQVVVISQNDNLGDIIIRVTEQDCIRLKEDRCVKACITKDPTGLYMANWITEVGPEGCTQKIDCNGDDLWTIRTTKIDCAGKKLEYEMGDRKGQLRVNDWSLCNSIKTGLCYSVCVKKINDESYLVNLAKAPDISCDVACRKGLKVKNTSCEERNIVCTGPDGSDLVVVLPDSFDCKTISSGDCINVCGRIGQDNVVKGEIVELSRCQDEQPQRFSGRIEKDECDKGFLQVDVEGIVRKVKLPDNYNCTPLKKLSSPICVEVEGWPDPAQAGLWEAKSVTVIECAKTKQTFDMYVYDVFCNAKEPFFVGRWHGQYVSVATPKPIDCSKITVGDCVQVTGVLSSLQSTSENPDKMIVASQIVRAKCPPTEHSYAKVTKKDCENKRLRVFYDSTYWDLLYPKTLDCNSIEEGACLEIEGVDFPETKIIEGYDVKKVQCKEEDPSLKLFITAVDCDKNQYVGICKKRYYLVTPPQNDFECTKIGVGDCCLVKGDLDDNKKSNVTKIKAKTIEKTNCGAIEKRTGRILEINDALAGGYRYIRIRTIQSDYIVFLSSSRSSADYHIGHNWDFSGYIDEQEKSIYLVASKKNRSSDGLKIKIVGVDEIDQKCYCAADNNGEVFLLHPPSFMKCKDIKLFSCYWIEGTFNNEKHEYFATDMVLEPCE